MSEKKTSKTARNDAVKNRRFVVTRNGLRVSDSEYQTKEEAHNEYNHWHKIVTRWPDGTKIEIVEFDDRKHKIF